MGKTTVDLIIKEYNEMRTVTVPKKKWSKKSILDTIKDFDKNVVHTHVHRIWFRGEISTVDKIHKAISADDSLLSISHTNLFCLLKALNFRYTKWSWNSAPTKNN